MKIFLTILELFILRVLFNKDEYNVNSSKFNPIKIIMVVALLMSSAFGIYSFNQAMELYAIMDKECHDVLDKYNMDHGHHATQEPDKVPTPPIPN